MAAPTAQFELFQDHAEKWRWRLRAVNGEIVAVSESYDTKQGAEQGASRVATLAPSAVFTVVDG